MAYNDLAMGIGAGVEPAPPCQNAKLAPDHRFVLWAFVS